MSEEVRVVFEPSGRGVFVLPGTVMLEAAARAGFIIQSPCGGAGKCGKCLVRVRAGECPPLEIERRTLGEERVAEGFRLACQAKIHGPLIVEIPETSLFQTQQKILTTADEGELHVQPRVSKRYVELPLPQQHDARSDLDRLHEALGPFETSITALRALPRVLRSSHFKVTAVLVENRLINIAPGNTASQCYGVAFDIGSTTIVGTLVNLLTGEDMALSAKMNPQTSFGDDVVSRIHKCRKDPQGLAQLQEAVLGTINAIIDDVVSEANISRMAIYEVVFAGNTTMQEILCGIDPTALGELPFVAAFTESIEMPASELDLHTNPEANVYVFPQIGGFVGGDTVSGIVATRLDQFKAPALLVDIGTNGEIVLAHNGRLLATSVAAGPAFEGARITNGMRGTAGAIEKVVFDGEVRLNVIGNTRPSGICGTGLIDCAAEMLRHGLLESSGRIVSAEEAPAGVPACIRERLISRGAENHFLLVREEDSGTGEPIFLYQRDVRELQLANAAIRAGINILLRTAGIEPEALEAVLLAGAFGNFIRRNNARRIGMLPLIPCDRIRFVGNAASFGAKRALLSTSEKEYAERIIRQVEHIDLSLDPEFQMEFGAAMIMPEHEADECR